MIWEWQHSSAGELWVVTVGGWNAVVQRVGGARAAWQATLTRATSPAVRTMLARVVAQLYPQATIVEACDGAQALSVAAQQRPDLIITDYHMPMINGLELIRTLCIRTARHSFLGWLTLAHNTKEARVYRSLLVAVLAVGLLFVPSAVAQSDQRCFPETNQCISGRIRAFWEQNGGLPVFGFPTTSQHEEMVAGKPYQVQLFERNRMELHPENLSPYDVLLGRLGADRLQQQGRDWFTFPKADPNAPHYFAETGHAIAPQFWSYWSSHGLELDRRRGSSFAESLALFGMPLSEPAVETNSGGATVLTQWFERARFELHSENAPPYDVLLGLLGNEAAGGAVAAPAAQPRPIDNPYFPLKPGTTFSYDGTADGHPQHDEVVVTHEIKVIQGVPCVVVHDTVTQDGQVIEATTDWYAQDQAGVVWYYGEDVKEYENGALVSTDGTWQAGVNGAQAGIIMQAHPQAGTSYYQENAANVAEDQAQVLALNGSISVPYGSYTNALVTKEWTRLDPGVVDEVSYAPGVGLIQDKVVQGGQEQFKLVSITTE